MNIEELVQYINRITPAHLVRFVSEKGENSCDDCLKYHNQIFEENDKNRPELPIHPNCRCKYEYLTSSEVTELQNELLKIHNQLISYGNQLANKINQLLEEYEREIKNYTQIHTISTIKSAFSAAWQMMQLIEKGKDIKKALTTTADNAKLTTIVTGILAGYWAMKNIEKVNKSLQEKMQQTGNRTVLPEIISLLSPMQSVETLLKEWHYNRLLLPEQQLENLPRTPEEAIKRGFVKASENQNLYHRNKGQLDNVKYYNNETKQEVIFNSKGEIVTDIENIGTYNYFSPEGLPGILHIFVDVIPYYRWGNGEKDTTRVGSRILGPEQGKPIDDFIIMIEHYITMFNIICKFEKNTFNLIK